MNEPLDHRDTPRKKRISNFFGRIFLHSKILIVLTLLSFLTNIITWVILYLFITPSELPITLHYNIYFGPDLIGEWYRIFLLPLSGAVILMVNLFFSYLFSSSNRINNYFFIGSAYFCQLMLLIASFWLIRQNI